MILQPFEKLPAIFQNEAVKKYYDTLDKKRASLVLKRITDVFFSLILAILLLIPMAVIAVMVKATSKGPVLYCQERVTARNKTFRILKFRTMRQNADKIGALVTSEHDARITPVGAFLRKYRLDELPQVFNVLSGSMSFVGTRPEVRRYVDRYTDEMMATLLMPAGVTSLASIEFKDEDKMIGEAQTPDEVDRIYVEEILPKKMVYNLRYLEDFGFFTDFRLMLSTFTHVLH